MTHDEPQPGKPPSPEPDFDPGSAVLRLLVGLMLEGTDELMRRLREWEAEVAQAEAAPAAASTQTTPPGEADRRVYALIGMIFAAREQVERDTQAWLSSPGQTAQRLMEAADHLTQAPLLGPFIAPLVNPLKAQAAAMSEQLHDEVQRWVAIGQAEAQSSRALARVAVPQVIDEVLEHLADNPELQDLIQQQSIGLAEEVVDSVREVTVTADAVLERVVRGLFGRKPRTQLSPPQVPLLPEHSQNGHKEPHPDDRP